MSKILVVEPWKMLQQAIALTLIPDHQVSLSAAIPTVEEMSAREYDALIIDATALKEHNRLNAEGISALQEWGIPTLWIEDDNTRFAPTHEKAFVIKRPIEKKTILSAVAACLTRPRIPSHENKIAQQLSTKDSSKNRPEKKASDTSAADAQLIELVDVIEEGPPQKK